MLRGMGTFMGRGGRCRTGIDLVWDPRNLGWAPNRGHTKDNLTSMVDRLERLDANNGTPDQFVDLLQTLLGEAERR